MTDIIWTNDRANWTAEGFDIIARIVVDDDPDLSYLDQPGWEAHKRKHQAGDFGHVGVEVRAYLAGVELGYGSLWGIEFSGDDESYRYCAECAARCASDALAEARRVLIHLRPAIDALPPV
jgi:hypothetical protein